MAHPSSFSNHPVAVAAPAARALSLRELNSRTQACRKTTLVPLLLPRTPISRPYSRTVRTTTTIASTQYMDRNSRIRVTSSEAVHKRTYTPSESWTALLRTAMLNSISAFSAFPRDFSVFSSFLSGFEQ